MVLNEYWYTLIDLDKKSDNSINATIQVREGSLWFRGHFPGNPILPGIAQLSMVFDLIQQSSDQKRKIKKINKTKFRKPVKPDDTLEITIISKDIDTYNFLIMNNSDLISRGVMSVE